MKWFEKGYLRFDGSNYFDILFLSDDSPYSILEESEEISNQYIEKLNDCIEALKKEFNLTVNTSDSVLSAIILSYKLLHNGSFFGNLKRPVRAIERDYSLNKRNQLKQCPKTCEKIFNKIKWLSLLSVEDLSKIILPKDPAKQQGPKDRRFIENKLKDKGYTDCIDSYEEFTNTDIKKAYIAKSYKKVLNKMGLFLEKDPDFVVKNNNILYIGENKCYFEDGGAQNFSKKDGLSIFSINNTSSYDIRCIFCFDGNLDLIKKYSEKITLNNKIMSIFDIVDYIESLE
jgi:hypothetical protein